MVCSEVWVDSSHQTFSAEHSWYVAGGSTLLHISGAQGHVDCTRRNNHGSWESQNRRCVKGGVAVGHRDSHSDQKVKITCITYQNSACYYSKKTSSLLGKGTSFNPNNVHFGSRWPVLELQSALILCLVCVLPIRLLLL